MRVRLTVTPRIESPGPGSVDREAGANPARTRHCHRGSPSHARCRPLVRSRTRKARRVGPGARRPPSDHKPEALVERGGSLQLHRLAGLVAGFLCLAAFAATTAVAAGPANVTVRAEGASGTLVEEGGFRTTTTPVNKRG